MPAGVSIAAGVTEYFPSATQLGNITSTQVAGAITASNGGTGLTAVSSGYVVLGNGSTTLAQSFHSNRLIAYTSGVSLAASGDQLMTMTSTNASCIVRRVTIANDVNALATVVAVATVRTASGGGGSAITGTLVFTGLTATNTYLDQTVTLASTTVNSSQFYIQITTAFAGVGTLPLYIWGDYLP